MPRKSKGIIMYLAMFGLLIVLLFAMMSMDKPVSTMKYYEVLDYFKQGKVEEYQIDYDNGNLTMKIEGKNQPVEYQLASISQFKEDVKPYIDQYEQTNDTTFKRNYLPAKRAIADFCIAADLTSVRRHGGAVDFHDASGWRRRRQDEHLRQGKTKAGRRWTPRHLPGCCWCR